MPEVDQNNAVLLLGGNIGNTNEVFEFVRQRIGEEIGEIIRTSSIYKTAPWGNTDQQDFLNQALLVDSQLQPTEILWRIIIIEKEAGRVREEKWGPRIIDIDILVIGQTVLETPELKLPHPFLHERKFALFL